MAGRVTARRSVNVPVVDEHRRGRPRWRADEDTGEYVLLADRWHTCFFDLSGDQGLLGQVEVVREKYGRRGRSGGGEYGVKGLLVRNPGAPVPGLLCQDHGHPETRPRLTSKSR